MLFPKCFLYLISAWGWDGVEKTNLSAENLQENLGVPCQHAFWHGLRINNETATHFISLTEQRMRNHVQAETWSRDPLRQVPLLNHRIMYLLCGVALLMSPRQRLSLQSRCLWDGVKWSLFLPYRILSVISVTRILDLPARSCHIFTVCSPTGIMDYWLLAFVGLIPLIFSNS